MQSTLLNNNTATHCNVQCGKELHKFILPNSEYEDLSNQVRATFGFAPDQILFIKYIDDEGDMITISSDTELKFAIGLFDSGLLHLTICNKKGRSCKGANVERRKWDPAKVETNRQMWKAKMQANPELLQKKIEKLQSKVTAMKERQQWLEDKATKDFNPSIPHRIAHFQIKLQMLEPRLAHLQNLAGVKASPVSTTVEVVQPAPPADPADLFKQTKEQIKTKKEQMTALRTQVKDGTLQRTTATEKIFHLKEEIGQLREQLNANRQVIADMRQHKQSQGRGRGHVHKRRHEHEYRHAHGHEYRPRHGRGHGRGFGAKVTHKDTA
jgi:predicted  nucleic acid-binding Zn-ribbon protein